MGETAYWILDLWGLKPIFHRNLCSCWLPNANENDTNNMKVTCPTQTPTLRGSILTIFHRLRCSTEQNHYVMAVNIICNARVPVDLSAANVPEQIPRFLILLSSEHFISKIIKGNKHANYKK